MNIINKIKLFLANESGAETVEWVLVCAGIAAVAVFIYSTGTGGNSTLASTITTGIAKIKSVAGW